MRRSAALRWLGSIVFLAAFGVASFYVGTEIQHTLEPQQCFVAKVSIDMSSGPSWLARAEIGEQVLCARGFRWTHIYGPDLETFFQRGMEFEDGGQP